MERDIQANTRNDTIQRFINIAGLRSPGDNALGKRL